MKTIDYTVNPSITPYIFVCELISVWVTASHSLQQQIITTATELVEDLYLTMECTMFASSTIATAAIMLAFSKFRIDPLPWLELLPKSYLASFQHSPLCVDDTPHLNVDLCLLTFRQFVSVLETSEIKTNNIRSSEIVHLVNQNEINLEEDPPLSDTFDNCPSDKEISRISISAPSLEEFHVTTLAKNRLSPTDVSELCESEMEVECAAGLHHFDSNVTFKAIEIQEYCTQQEN